MLFIRFERLGALVIAAGLLRRLSRTRFGLAEVVDSDLDLAQCRGRCCMALAQLRDLALRLLLLALQLRDEVGGSLFGRGCSLALCREFELNALELARRAHF